MKYSVPTAVLDVLILHAILHMLWVGMCGCGVPTEETTHKHVWMLGVSVCGFVLVMLVMWVLCVADQTIAHTSHEVELVDDALDDLCDADRKLPLHPHQNKYEETYSQRRC